MYKIGEFSILNDVTVKTLRYYDEIGLFKPRVIDKYTGYRYYEDEQLYEFRTIMKYKELGFTLDEIKRLSINKNEILLNKINELTKKSIEIDEQINRLKTMVRKQDMNVEYKYYKEYIKVGKRVTLKSRNDIDTILSEIKDILIKNNISFYNPVVCNFELGYEYENIDAFVGYQIDNDRDLACGIKDKTGLETIYNNKEYRLLVCECKKEFLEDGYKNMITYAHDREIQIRGFYTEVYEKDYVTIYVEAKDLNEENKNQIKHLNKLNEQIDFSIRDSMIGTYELVDILPDSKYMFNPNKKKNLIPSKYDIVILNKDGTTNIEGVKWNKKGLLVKHDDIYIDHYGYPLEKDGKTYFEVLMNETEEYYSSALPMSYIFKRISK